MCVVSVEGTLLSVLGEPCVRLNVPPLTRLCRTHHPRTRTHPPAGEVEVFSFPAMRRERTLRGHTSGVLAVAVDPQQRYLASGGADSVACLWDLQASGRGRGAA